MLFRSQIKTKSPSAATCNELSFMTITAVECMTTDRQLMMILRTLTEKMNVDISNLEQEDRSSPSISWAEFIQCYKLCITSMMTLQNLPKGSIARLRTRERSLSMIELFGLSTSFPSSMGLTDLYMTPMHHTTTHSNETKPIPDVLTTSSATKEIATGTSTASLLTASALRRRPWLKKRTKRILPYLLVIALLILIGSWYYTSAMRKEREQQKDSEESAFIQSGTNGENFQHFQHEIAVPSNPSKSKVVVTHKNPSALSELRVLHLIPSGNDHYPSMLAAKNRHAQNRGQLDVTIQKSKSIPVAAVHTN